MSELLRVSHEAMVLIGRALFYNVIKFESKFQLFTFFWGGEGRTIPLFSSLSYFCTIPPLLTALVNGMPY